MAKDIINYKLPTKNCWFPDQVEPDIDDKEVFKTYWKREKDRCVNGFKLADDQVYVPGWLYFHTVYWTIELDTEIINPVTGKKESFKTKGIARLRDNEWETAHDLERAAYEKKIYDLVGARGFGKSFMCSSFIGQAYTFFDDSESLITAGNHPDIAKLAEKINLGLSNIHPVFRKQRLKNDWKKEVRAGWVDKSTGFEKGSASRIITRNYDDGNNTMATNGTRPKRQVVDEQGKIPNLIKCLLDSMPSWMNDFGFFSIPWITGTGGDMEVGIDAGIIFNNPAVYNVLEFDNPEGPHKIGKFIPVTKARNEYKEEWTLSKYLGINHPDLDKVIILVSNEEKCLKEFVEPRRAKAAGSTTSNELIKEKAYYPLVPSECFLTISSNDFPIDACKEQLKWLDDNDFQTQKIELYRDLEGKVQMKHTDKKPVSDFPVKADSHKEGVIEILERPIEGVSYMLYAGGIDPYKISESDYSDSLGCIYLIKRMTTNMSEPYQYMPIAWYAGRPKEIEKWQENVAMLLEWYGCKAMCENIDYGFIQHMVAENKAAIYLEEGQSFLKEINPNSKSKGLYGLPPTPQTINHWNGSAVKYTSEMYATERDDKGNVINKRLGVTRILDRMLLKEMIAFNKNQGNFDRVRAFGIAIAYANQLDSLGAKIEIEREWKKQTKVIRTPFAGMSTGIGKLKSPFRTRI